MTNNVSKGTGIGFGFCLGIILFIIFIIAVFIGSAILIGGYASYIANNTNNNSKEKTQQTITETKSEKPKKWTNIITLSGNTNKTSKIFNLGDGEKRIIYTFKGDKLLSGTIEIYKKGETTFAEEYIQITKPVSDSSYLYIDAGEYYLKVDSLWANWTVTIQEKK